MRRLLSQTLIILLLLLGPITFTTASIPNFQPDCKISRSLSIKTSVTVAVIQPTATIHLPGATGITPSTGHIRRRNTPRKRKSLFPLLLLQTPAALLITLLSYLNQSNITI